MATATHTGPIQIEQINAEFYVTGAANGFTTIQQAVDFVRINHYGVGTVIVQEGVNVADDINAVTGGSTNTLIWDNRVGNNQHWIWNGTKYVANPFIQKSGIAVMDSFVAPLGSISMVFDITGDVTTGAGGIVVSANPGQPTPFFYVNLRPGDGGAAFSIFQCGTDENGVVAVNLAENVTVAGDETIAGNLFVGGGITGVGMHLTSTLAVDGATQLSGDVTCGADIQAQRGDYTSLFVLGSQVLTAADLPPDAIPYPPAGVPVSTGTAWSPSINPADLPRLSTPNTFAQIGTFNLGINVKGQGSTVLGSMDTLVTLHNNVRFTSVGPDPTHTGGFQFDGWSSDTSFGKQYAIFFNDTPSDNTKAQAIIWVPTTIAADLNVNGDETISGTVTAGSFNAGLPGSLRAHISVNGITSYYDAYGVDAATNGAFAFRSVRSDGSNIFTALSLDSAGNANFNSILYAGTADSANGTLRLGSGVNVTDHTFPSVTSVFGSLQLDSTGPGAVFLCMNAGGATIFGNGSGTEIGRVSGNGDAHFNGALTAGSKSFLIAHPLIEGKDLIHGSLEGPEHGVYYRGEVATKKGKAEVKLPDYFEALTFDEDRSILLTQICESGDEQYAMLMATRVIGGRFQILSSVPSVKIVWEVKAVRRIGVDRLAVVRDRFVHPKKEAAHESERSREEGTRTRTRTSSTHRA